MNPLGRKGSRPGRNVDRKKNSSASQGRWPEEPEGFPMHFHIRMANRRVVMTPNGEQNGHYGRRMANKKAITPRMTNKRNLPTYQKILTFQIEDILTWQSKISYLPKSVILLCQVGTTVFSNPAAP